MPQDIVITPNRGSTTSGAQIAFTGYSGASSIYLKVLPDSSLSFEGSAGQLFSITDNLSSGTIFSVNDITGIPSFDVNANGLVRIAPFAGNVALGTTATSGKLQINTGSATTIGQIIQGASGQSSNFTEWRNVSGSIFARVNASGEFFGLLSSGIVTSGSIASGQIGIYHLASGAASAAAVAGISGQIQFNAGGILGASAAVTFASGGPNLGITTQSTGNIPFRITTASGHTTNSLEIYHSGALSAYISPDGILGITQNYGGALKVNTVINGSLGNPSVQYRNVVIGANASIASGAGVGEAVAIGYGAYAQGQYGVAIGQGANAGYAAIAIGLNANPAGNNSVGIGYATSLTHNYAMGFGNRATSAAAGDIVFATETQNATIRIQTMSTNTGIVSYLGAIANTWINSTDATKTSRLIFSTYYTTSAQEAFRIDSASDQARTAIGGAILSGSRLSIYTGLSTDRGLVVQGFTSQTANLQEWQNSAGSVIARVNASGEFFGLLSSGIVTSGAIASGSIGNFHLSSGAVTSGEIGNASVVSGSISSGAVGAYHFNATGLASGRSLSTDGTGVLSWATGGGGGLTISDDTSTNATRYLTFTSATTGSISTANVSSTKLSFNPSTGDFTAGGNITANSDARIKTNVQTISGALQKVIGMRGVYFDRIGTNIKNVGVIAQEIEAIVPELVRESDGLKSVAYGNITALLIEVIKEQSKKIEELENKLCQLTSSQS